MLMYRYILFSLVVFIFSCRSEPKVIEADNSLSHTGQSGVDSASNIMSSTSSSQSNGMDNAVHRVVANEILQTDKYTYLKVAENGKQFWIATAKTDAIKGKAYIYRGGLLKTNFPSKEFNKVFDTLYLVSNILSEDQHPGSGGGPAMQEPVASNQSHEGHQHSADAIKISEIFNKKKELNGKEIVVEGECIKVNNGIMGRNWIHIQDGSKKDGKKAEITVTTLAQISVGQHVALRGLLAVDKDFGAGYRYDVIIENAEAQ